MKVGLPKSGSDTTARRTSGATRRTAIGLLLGAPLLSACTVGQFSNSFGNSEAAPAGPPQQPATAGTGHVKVGLVLPMSASGNAGVAAQSMKNASEMALAEFQNPNIQLLIKDDGGTPQGAQQGAQQALDEGAEIILGPLFAASVPQSAQVAGHGVFLLSFLPESDVNRIVDYSAGVGKKSFAALLPDNAYGNVVEVAFKQAVARKGGRIVAFEKYGSDRATSARNIAQALGQADALLIADDGESVVTMADALTAAGATSSCSAPGCGTIRESFPALRCRAASTRPRTLPASGLLPAAIAPDTDRTRCELRRWPMTRLRSLRRSPSRADSIIRPMC
jgi:ABC-type branched-subunit amino acid transport system substrate-binding protein